MDGRTKRRKRIFKQTIKFKINDLVDLRLKRNKTHIYINNQRFIICAHILIDIPVRNIPRYDEIKSIDEAIDSFKSTERIKYMISPEEEFMGHCSNIQAFFENGLNTDILHTNIAFPLLKKLVELKFEPARRVFKQEIVERYNNGTTNSRYFLNSRGYLNYLNREEKQALKGFKSTMVHRPDYFYFLFKIAILGDDGVGRSTLAIDHLNSRDYSPRPLIGVNFAIKNIALNNYEGKFQIWFPSNLKHHEEFIKFSLNGTLGSIIMYDITNINSFNSVPKWIQIIREIKDTPIILVGNKSGLNRDRVVSKEQGNEFKEKYDLSLFMEVSLRSGEDVDAIFTELAHLIVNQYSLTN